VIEMQPKVIIHGGFFSESSTTAEVKAAKQAALLQIANAAHTYLQTHTAVETAVYAVALLENDPLFNAGTGSQIQSDGHIRMSASLMDGQTALFSGVINVENVQNPIHLAALLQKEADRVLGGEGAGKYANEQHFPAYNPEIPQRRAEYVAKLAAIGVGTVGCVAIDQSGRIAAATSTGGKGFERVGRISDSATVAGNYANEFCGVSCTGVGEDIVSAALAAKIVTRVTDGMSIENAFARSFQEMKPYDGFAGAIAIDKSGNIFHLDSHPSMVWASFDGETACVFE
jgi:L-asparaginase